MSGRTHMRGQGHRAGRHVYDASAETLCAGSALLGQGDPEARVVGRLHRNGPGPGCIRQSCSAAGVEKISEIHVRKLPADFVGQLIVELTWRAGAVEGFLVADKFGQEVLLARCQRDPLDVKNSGTTAVTTAAGIAVAPSAISSPPMSAAAMTDCTAPRRRSTCQPPGRN